MSDALKALRDALDAVDRRLVSLLAERQGLVQQVLELKKTRPAALRDRDREEALLTRLAAIADEVGADPLLVTRVYQEVLSHSVRWQRQQLVERDNPPQPVIRVAIQGRPGSYSDQAARRHFASSAAEVVYEGHDSFRSMLEAVRSGVATYGMLPIENTTAGSIVEAYDLLTSMALHIVGEEVQPVEHCLIGLPGATIDGLRSVWSHPQALLQCTRFLSSLSGCTPRSGTDTAGSCERIAAQGDPSQGAIASVVAAERLGLSVLKRGIADQKANFTRMVVVAAHPAQVDPRIPCKTSLVFGTRHEHGALLRALRCFEAYALSLLQLQSRPRPGSPFEYLFYVDVEGNPADGPLQQALEALATQTSTLRVLGTYPAATGATMRPSRPRAHEPSVPSVPSPAVGVGVGDIVIGRGAPVWFVETDDPAAAATALAGRDDVILVGPPDRVVPVGVLAGWPCASEVTAADALDVATRVDMVVVRGRDMANAAVLDAVGALHRPVLLERDPAATTAEWLESAARIRAGGNQQVVLAERGVAHGPGLRATPQIDLSTLVDLAAQGPLVVVADGAIARAALAAGAHGAWVQGVRALTDP